MIDHASYFLGQEAAITSMSGVTNEVVKQAVAAKKRNPHAPDPKDIEIILLDFARRMGHHLQRINITNGVLDANGKKLK